MCQAIVKPQGVTIDKEVLRRAWNANADGAGIAYRRDDGHIEIRKGFFKFKNFWKFYLKVEERDCLIHFRWATHGSKKQENCHPFNVGNGAMVHNGIMSKFEPLKGDDRSDTRVFVDTFLSPLLQDTNTRLAELLSDKRIERALERMIGASKLAFLTPESGFHIINESMGEWVDGAWYSAGYPEDWDTLIRGTGWSKLYTDYAEGETIPSLYGPECALCYEPMHPFDSYRIGHDEVCVGCWKTFTDDMED